LLNIPAEVIGGLNGQFHDEAKLSAIRQQQVEKFVGETEAKNKQYFEEENQKLDAWAEESMRALSQEISDLLSEIKALKKQARLVEGLEEKVAIQRQVKALEAKRNKKQMEYFQSQNNILEQQEKLLDEVAAKLKLSYNVEPVFLIRCELV
jgi:predicted ATPase